MASKGSSTGARGKRHATAEEKARQKLRTANNAAVEARRQRLILANRGTAASYCPKCRKAGGVHVRCARRALGLV